jgi:hypothetical protein
MVEQARAAGADEQAAAANAAKFTEMYANPLFRIPMTFLEIFPVGILVSLISAALLKNSRFLPPAHKWGHSYFSEMGTFLIAAKGDAPRSRHVPFCTTQI